MTTTDPFAEAARAEAERQNPAPTTYTPDGPSQWERLLAQKAFRNGAEWARTHLAAQEPTDAEVEAAANAIIALVPGETEETADMDDIDDAWDHARAALSAARAALRAARRDEATR